MMASRISLVVRGISVSDRRVRGWAFLGMVVVPYFEFWVMT